jgi:hypothetical protein
VCRRWKGGPGRGVHLRGNLTPRPGLYGQRRPLRCDTVNRVTRSGEFEHHLNGKRYRPPACDQEGASRETMNLTNRRAGFRRRSAGSVEGVAIQVTKEQCERMCDPHMSIRSQQARFPLHPVRCPLHISDRCPTFQDLPRPVKTSDQDHPSVGGCHSTRCPSGYQPDAGRSGTASAPPAATPTSPKSS